MRVPRLISAPNWRYAIGEILLIVIGVSIALAASSWYEGRLERRNSESSDVDGGSQSWVPIDYVTIKNEHYIANLCRFRADLLRRFALAQFESTTAVMHEILGLIDKELANAD